MTSSVRITSLWVLLSALTVASWLLATAAGHHPKASALESLAVLAIGAVKARFIIREFMEVRTGPRWLQRFTDGWLAVLWAAVVTLYLY